MIQNSTVVLTKTICSSDMIVSTTIHIKASWSQNNDQAWHKKS